MCILGMPMCKYLSIGQCCMHNISHKHLPNGASNHETTNKK
jgi:hypothetical protein